MKVICVDDSPVILQHTVSLCERNPKIDEVHGFTEPEEGLRWIEENPADIALLDIEMPGMTGIELAEKIKRSRPGTAVIFLTAYPQYAVDAFSVRASGYLVKPVSEEQLNRELDYVFENHPPARPESRIRVKTFGNFDVFIGSDPIRFKSSKSKELLAYLVDRRGGSVTRAEAFAVLWEDREYDRGMQKQLDVIIRSLRETLRQYDAEEIFEMKMRTMRVCPERFSCDSYQFFDGDVDAVNSYAGEYMNSYSWASMTESFLTWKLTGEK